jgi:hypothetical protein
VVERMVVNHLTYQLEEDHTISHLQSAFQSSRSTVDPLMQLIADATNGFESYPALCTVIASLDIKQAYNHTEHYKLLDNFETLNIPPVYARFFRGFL